MKTIALTLVGILYAITLNAQNGIISGKIAGPVTPGSLAGTLDTMLGDA